MSMDRATTEEDGTMERKRRGLVTMLALVIALGVLAPLNGAERPGKPAIYDPALDVPATIASALPRAKAENRHLLLMFGANWCPWCHRLHELFAADARIAALLKRSYLLILVDVGEKKTEPLNQDLLKKYRLEGFGYPALAVLAATGTLLSTQNSGVLEEGQGHSPVKVLGYLKANAPAIKPR